MADSLLNWMDATKFDGLVPLYSLMVPPNLDLQEIRVTFNALLKTQLPTCLGT